jgi:hypothetical protein
MKRMKRVVVMAFSILMLCCLLVGNVTMLQAFEAGYEVQEAYDTATVTVDGNWVTGEWEDSWIEYMDNSTNDERFCYKADSDKGYAPEFLIDSADTTDDAGDIWQICFDGGAASTPDGGPVPLESDNKIEITGHTTLKVYVGNGTGWEEMDDSAVTWADSLTTHDVPFDYEHWCVEIIVDKATLNSIWGPNAPPIGLRVAMYDETEDTWVSWPPASDPDVPDGWGRVGEDYGSSIPESLSFVVIVLLSTVAVAVMFYLVRKRPKAERYSSARKGIDCTI